MRAKSRLGLLGPAIVLVGLAIGGLGIWFVVSSKPKPGDIIDTIAIEDGASFVVYSENGGDRSFVELHAGDEVRWQALVPHYAGGPGRSGIAWNRDVVTVRVERAGREELWVLSMKDSGAKLAQLLLAPEHEPIPAQTTGPLTITDHIRSYELVNGDKWRQLVAIDLTGRALWKVELGWPPVTSMKIEGGQVVVDQEGGVHRLVNVFNGRWYFPDMTHANPAALFNLPL